MHALLVSIYTPQTYDTPNQYPIDGGGGGWKRREIMYLLDPGVHGSVRSREAAGELSVLLLDLLLLHGERLRIPNDSLTVTIN